MKKKEANSVTKRCFSEKCQKKVPEPKEYTQLMKSDEKQTIERKRRRKKLPELEEYSQKRGIKFRSKTGSKILATVLANIDSFTKMSILH